MRITPDTAILVRTNAKARGPARELLQVIQQTGACLVLSPFLLNEVARALRYPRLQAIYHLDDEAIAAHIRLLESIADVVAPAEGPPIVLKDPADDPVVYTAVAGQADVICTLDHHFFEPNVLAFCAATHVAEAARGPVRSAEALVMLFRW
jgi:putative PIN family toxin of toxin-antitoxin system